MAKATKTEGETMAKTGSNTDHEHIIPILPPSKGHDDGTYYIRTDLVEQNGDVPTCCEKPMVAMDDHGRFTCFTCGNIVAV